jgi:hypothetical protein
MALVTKLMTADQIWSTIVTQDKLNPELDYSL